MRSVCAMALAGLLGIGSLGSQALAASTDQMASGLIVKLKPSAAEGALSTPSQVTARFGRLGRLAQKAGYTANMPWRHLGGRTVSMRVPTRLSPDMQRRMIDRLMASGQVEWVEPNVRQTLSALTGGQPNDPYYQGNGVATGYAYEELQWWLKNVTAEYAGVPKIRQAWNVTTGGAPSTGVVIAVLDTGHLNHPDLPTPLPGYDFVSDAAYAGDGNGWDSDPTDPGDFVTLTEANDTRFKEIKCGADNSSWHGQVIEGLIAATSDNNGGVAGINWGARILPVRVAGKCGADLDDIVAGMYWAAGLSIPQGVLSPGQTQPSVNGNPAKIVNISFGGSGTCGNTYQDAINQLRANGVVVVAAAGNEHGTVSRPANCSGVVAVAALNRAGFKTTYSNFGPEITLGTVGGDPAPDARTGYLDAGAWGTVLFDTGLLTVVNEGSQNPGTNSYAYHAGTSYSAPIVSGVISLMLTVNPSLTPQQIIAGLKASARPHVVSSQMGSCSDNNPGRCICTKATCGEGILDAEQALVYAGNPASYTAPAGGVVTVNASDIANALAIASQDRPANQVGATTAGSGGGGGGGAMSLADVWLLLGALSLAWFSPGGIRPPNLSSRRQ